MLINTRLSRKGVDSARPSTTNTNNQGKSEERKPPLTPKADNRISLAASKSTFLNRKIEVLNPNKTIDVMNYVFLNSLQLTSSDHLNLSQMSSSNVDLSKDISDNSSSIQEKKHKHLAIKDKKNK